MIHPSPLSLPSAPTLPCAPEAVDEFLSRPPASVSAVLAKMPGPVLVLGAAGKMGLHLSAMIRRGFAAAGRTERVLAVSRFTSLRGREEFEAMGVGTVACDLTDPHAVAQLPEAPTVFFLAGVKFGTAGAPEVLRKFNVDMPRLVAARFGRSRIVAFSSGCVYPFVPVESGGATETTPLQPMGDYAASCVERERAFDEAARSQGTAVALIRLNYAVEFRYGVLVDIAEKVWRGEPIDLTTGHVNVIWQTDALAHTINALALAASPAEPVNVTGPAVCAVRDLALRFGRLLQRPVTFIGREAPTAWLNRADRLHRRFGLPPTSVEQMTEWVAAWQLRRHATWNKRTGYEKRDGRF